MNTKSGQFNLSTFNLQCFKKINDNPKVLDSEYELKSFINNGHATVIYENDQMNTVVYKQLNELYQYLENLESKVNEIKANIK